MEVLHPSNIISKCVTGGRNCNELSYDSDTNRKLVSEEQHGGRFIMVLENHIGGGCV